MASPGVHLVLTGADAQKDNIGGIPPLFMPEDMGGPKGYRTFRPLLEPAKARYVGDRIAFVVAETPEQARIAAELVEVDYEPLPAVVERRGRGEGRRAQGVGRQRRRQPRVPADDGQQGGDRRGVRQGEAHRLGAPLQQPHHRQRDGAARRDRRLHPPTTPTRSTRARRTRTACAASSRRVFKMPEIKLRVISPDVGGGFGMKGDIYPEDGLVLWASRKLGRPVKWVATRTESMLGDNHGRDQLISAEMALDENGKILAVRAQALHAVGAYVTNAGVVPVLCALRNIPNVYVVPAMLVMSKATFTHTTPLGPYRGAGRPEASYVIERLMDEAARKLGIDPVEMRRAQLHPAERHAVQHHGELDRRRSRWAGPTTRASSRRLTDRGLELADWDGFQTRKQESKRTGRLRGRCAHLLPRGLRRLQRAHGAALRSERHGHGRRRHAFPRPGPRHDLRAARLGLARRAVREHPPGPGRHRRGLVRPRHLRLAQRDARRLGAEGRRRRDHREGAS